MAFDLLTPTQLVRVRENPKHKVSTSAWLNMFYPSVFQSTQEEILFSEIKSTRKIAPFRLPNMPGIPVYKREGETIESFRPAYIKVKDAVKPGEMIAMSPGEIVRRVGLMTPAQRYDAEIFKIVGEHENQIRRRWDQMAAHALINGQAVIDYRSDDGNVVRTVTIDFGRDPNHTITKTAGNRWGESGVNVFQDCQEWIDIVANADFGGNVTDIILGSQAAAPFLASDDIKDKLDTNYRGSEEVYVNRGIIRTDPLNPFTLLGTLGSGVNVWRYSGPGAKYQNDDGSFTDIMDPRDALFVAPSVDGVQAFGAIVDKAANLAAIDIFMKMFDQDDPSATFVLSQSAPLFIPTNPNATLKARVVA